METKLLFAAKFGELEAQYARLEQRFALCRAGDRESIRQECDLLADECMAWENALSVQANGGRSKAVEALSLAQLSYSRQVRQIMEHELPRFLHSEGDGNNAEGAALYAEYALDAAAQAMRHALMAALYATGLQMDAEQDRTAAGNSPRFRGLGREVAELKKEVSK